MMYINGHWINAVSGSIFPVHNPSNNEKIGEVADGNQDDARQAIEAAHGVLESWSGLTAYQRSEYLYTAYQLMMEQKEHLARVMTEEQGKP
jgi:succinate-semialdehyde dehydrogenase / glutarate-semialdehyde dehydrogenase